MVRGQCGGGKGEKEKKREGEKRKGREKENYKLEFDHASEINPIYRKHEAGVC